MQEIASHIATTRGAALNIDYGHLKAGFGDTLQAMLKHSFDDVFANPGIADLTSHVDFDILDKTARASGCKTGMMTQGEFLLAMGLVDRAGRLGAGKDAAFQEKSGRMSKDWPPPIKWEPCSRCWPSAIPTQNSFRLQFHDGESFD